MMTGSWICLVFYFLGIFLGHEFLKFDNKFQFWAKFVRMEYPTLEKCLELNLIINFVNVLD